MFGATRFRRLLPPTPPPADTDIRSQADSRTIRRSTRSLGQLLNFSDCKASLGTASAQLRLKECIDIAARNLKFDVIAAKLVQVYEPNDHNDMRFELETRRGRLQAIRSRSSRYSFSYVPGI
jgi:hypothetical protein